MFPGLVDHYYPANAMLQNNGFISNLPNTQMFNENAETSATAVNHIDNNDNKLHNGNITIASHGTWTFNGTDKTK
jgi:hypothetical protein